MPKILIDRRRKREINALYKKNSIASSLSIVTIIQRILVSAFNGIPINFVSERKCTGANTDGRDKLKTFGKKIVFEFEFQNLTCARIL